MNKNTKILASAIIGASLLGASGSVMAATGNLNVEAEVVAALSIEQVTKLDFGAFDVASAAIGSTVLVKSDGTGRTPSGGIVLIPADPGSRGEMKITGKPNLSVTVSSPAGTTTLTSGSDTLTIANADWNYDGLLAGNKCTLDGSTGLCNFFVGATLKTTAAPQPAGEYANAAVQFSVAYD